MKRRSVRLRLERLEDRTMPSVPGDIDWLRQFGSILPAFGRNSAVVAADADGNVYVGGDVGGTLPGQTSAGLLDAFVRKYDAAGNVLWTRQFGSSSSDEARGVAVDATGVYVVGSTFGTLPGQTSAGGEDVFVRKYDAAGNELWTRQFGGTPGTYSVDEGTGVAVNASGVYVAGWTDTTTLPGQPFAGDRLAAFVRKYDAAGSEIWTRQFTSDVSVVASSVAADASGVYVSGWVTGVLPGGGGTDTIYEDAFVRKYDAAGNVVWTRQFGTAGLPDVANSVAADATGVSVVGYTQGALPGQIKAGQFVDFDAFVRKYDAGGNVLWTRQFGTTSNDNATAVTADAAGTYVAGTTGGILPGQSNNGGYVRKYDAVGTVVWTSQFGSSVNPTSIAANASGVHLAGNGSFPGQTGTGGADVFVRKSDAGGSEIWTRQFGGLLPETDLARAVDADGNVYVAGQVFGRLPGQTSNDVLDASDAFVRKYDALGNELWTRQFGSNSLDQATGITVDASGIYVVGTAGGALPGQTSASGFDAFVRKYDVAGNVIWTRQFGTPFTIVPFFPEPNDSATGVATDATGVYVAGSTNGAFPGQANAGGFDAFVRKYDHNGNLVWTRQFGTAGTDQATGVASNPAGEVYVTGDTSGALPGQTSSGGQDVFVRKYFFSGAEVWTRQFGTAASDQATGIAVDPVGVYVSGFTPGTFAGQTNAGGNDAFVRKYDVGGTEHWTREFGSADSDQANGIAVGPSGVYVAGSTTGTLPGQTSAGGQDAFVSQYAAAGNELWTRQFGTPATDSAAAVAVSASGLFVAGTTTGTFPGQTSSGLEDVFVAKIVGAVSNTAPSNLSLNLNASINENSTATLNGSFTDLDAADTHTIVINWGPGEGATTLSLAAGVTTFSATHLYLDDTPPDTASDVFTINVTASDASASTSSSACVTVTNVAPSATFHFPASVDEGDAIELSLTDPSDPSSADVAAGFEYAFDFGSGYGGWSSSNVATYLTTDNGILTVRGKIRDKDGGEREYPGGPGDVEWLRQFGSPAPDPGPDPARAVDADGNLYVAGDLPLVLPEQTSAGGIDAYVREYDANGNELWTRQFGTSSTDQAFGVAVDATAVYVAGYTEGTLPGQSSAGGPDAFVRKYDVNGNVLWTRQFGTTGTDAVLGIALDASGIYLTGSTTGAFPGQASAGGQDAFVRKYDAAGNVLWTNQFGTAATDQATGIAADDSGMYVSGSSAGTLPGQTSAGGEDAFARKYDAAGNVLWTRQFGTVSADQASGIAADGSGVYVTGRTAGALPGQTSAGLTDGFVRSYDASGNELWTRQFGSADSDQAIGVAAGGSSVYVTGSSEGTLPGQINAGLEDAFVRKYDANGNVLWTGQFGTVAADQALAVAVSASGLFVAGSTTGTFPGQISAGGQAAFVAKIVDSANVTVNNVAPSATFNVPASVNEGGTIQLSLTGPSDPSTADVAAGFEYAFDSGSGYGAWSSNVASFATTDNGTLTLRGKIRDKDGGEREYTAAVPVNNVAPTITSLSATPNPVDENGTVTLTGSFTDPGTQDMHTVVIDWGPGEGTTTLTAAAGVLTFSASHQYADDNPSGIPFTISVTVSDDDAGSATAGVDLAITPVNDAPVAEPDSYSTTEDTPLTVIAPGVLVNDSDSDSATLTAVLVAGPSHGSLGLNSDGSFSYTPALDYNGLDSFIYNANDGDLNSDTVTVSLTILALNDAPVAQPESHTTSEDTTLTVAAPGVLANDSDVDSAALTAVLVTGPSHGSLTFNSDGSFSYTAELNYNGPDSFTYKATDGTLDSAPAVVSLTITALNDAPVADPDTYSTPEDTPLTVSSASVLANDSDVDGDALTAILVNGPSHGTLTLNADGSFMYTPDADYNGSDSFTYKANDGATDSAPTVVDLTITAVNDAPVANPDSYSTPEDTPLTVTAAGVLTNDSDVEGDTLTAILVSGPNHGTLTFNADGSFSYTPALNYNGPDSFTYKANDGSLDSDTVTVSFTVTAVNDAPVANPDSFSVDQGGTLTVPAPGVLANDSDVDGDTLSAILVSGPSHGRLTFNASGSFSCTPDPGFSGTDSFSYQTTDGVASSAPVTVTLTVKPSAVQSKISGRMFTDLTGNGLTSDDTPLNGVNILLYRDDGDKVRDSADILVASATSATVNNVAGYYSFSNLTPGRYFVEEIVPTGSLRTYPLFANYNPVDVANVAVTGVNFANAEKCDLSIVTSVSFYVTHADGTTATVTNLRGNTRQGDTVAVNFTVVGSAGFAHAFSFMSYYAPGPSFDANTAAQQRIFDLDTATFAPGAHSLTVTIPDSYYQIDFVCGLAIDRLGPAGSNIFYTPQSRLFSADNCGTAPSVSDPGSIRGTKFVDLTGNGLTADDVAQHGVTIKLYRDANGNGKLDAGTDVFVSSKVTAGGGRYTFSNLSAGPYIVQEVVPSGYVQTWPVSGAYAVPVAANTVITGKDFADFAKSDTSAVSYISYKVTHMGVTNTYSTLQGHTHPGDTVKVVFSIVTGKTVQVTLVSYNAPKPTFDAALAYLQTIFSQTTGTWTGGAHSLTVTIPTGNYQIDFVCGPAIDHFGPAGSNIFYTPQGRLMSADGGGTQTLVSTAGAGASSDESILLGSLGQLHTGLRVVSADGLGRSAAEMTRVNAAMASLNQTLSAFGVILAQASPEDAATADIHIHFASTTVLGGIAEGVLGVTEAGGEITIVTGWNYYLGADASALARGQYDFQTVVTHELGHALGLGHSPDASSVMYSSLSSGEARRDLTAQDVTFIAHSDHVCGLHVAGATGSHASGCGCSACTGAATPVGGAGLPQILDPLSGTDHGSGCGCPLCSAALTPAASARAGGILISGAAAMSGQTHLVAAGSAWNAGLLPHDALGRGGHDLLLGGEGDDLRIGQEGRDVLIGGVGGSASADAARDRVLANHSAETPTPAEVRDWTADFFAAEYREKLDLWA